MQTGRRTFFIRFLLFLTLSYSCAIALAQPGFERPQELKAKQVLPESLRTGEFFRTESRVRNDGLFNDYILHSDFGSFHIQTTTLLRIRIREVYAIAAIREIETGDTAVEALKQSGKNVVTGAKNLIIHPVQTLGGAASMVEQLYTRTTGTIRRNASDAEDSAFSQLVGLARVKGEIASRFGVNMYSRNPVLQQELDRLARAAFLGSLSVKVISSVASSFAPVMGSVLISTSNAARLLNDMINTTPPAQMWLQNKQKLQAMELGLKEDQIEVFLNRSVFSPAMQTVLVESLRALDGVKNRALFINLALQVVDEARARLITEIAIMSAAYHKNIKPLVEFTPMAKILSSVTQAGTVVVLMPADHMIWNQNNARVMSITGGRAGAGKQAQKQLWILGDVSGKMRTHLLSDGWHVHTRAGRLLRARGR